MQNVASQPSELLLRATFKSQNSNTSTETATYRFNNATNFPLTDRSKDHILILEEEQSESLSDDCKIHLKLLQVVSLPPSDRHVQLQPSLTANFDTVSPDIVNKLDKSQGAAPLHYACLNGNAQMVTFLLEKGAQVNIWDGKRKVTPLICAAANGHLDIVKILLENGCDVDAGIKDNNNEQCSALLWSVRRNHAKVVSYLLEHNARQYSTVTFSETPIHAAVISGSTEILKMLINAQDKKVKSDFQMGSEKSTPLHLAASGEFDNSYEMCKILIEEGNGCVNSVNADEKTPLHEAVASQNVDIVRYLLTRLARVNAADKDGRSPLFYTVSDEKEALDCAQALVDTGKCNVNHQDKWGLTTLHTAGVYGAASVTELLLMNLADFSIKADGGATALSILRKNIPTTSALLHRAFDQAVTLTHYDDSPAKRQDSKVEVDFKYVLPAASNATSSEPPPEVKRSRFKRMTTMFRDLEEEENNKQAVITRKETSKLKCLVDEEMSSLLLHPVIHSFLELKWLKARRVFFPTLTFKMILVILYSIYVLIPYHVFNVVKGPILYGNTVPEITPKWFEVMYIVILVMAAVKGLGGLLEILRAPKQQLKTLHPWIAWGVLLIIVFFMQPYHWKMVHKSTDPFRRAMAALGILLGWLDLWAEMAAFPNIGLSIRVFFQVFKNFSKFILPHCCLLIGFILAFTLLFPNSGEFQSFGRGLTKVIRIMAGDITIVEPGQKEADPNSDVREILSHALLVYIYTIYVVLCSIVLANLLIGLAVNDIQGIYKDAAADKAIKQTLLLNVLETSFHGRWTGFCIPKKVFAKYINLFPSKGPENKVITFSPFDPSDSQLGSDLKKALLDIGSVNRVSESEKDKRTFARASVRTSRWSRMAFTKKLGRAYADEEQRELMENINKLVFSYLENKMSSKA